jgi:hypothetical protein
LLHFEVLDRVSHTTVAAIFDNAMKLLSKGEVERDIILLFITDSAPHMVKAARGLQVLYPTMVHLAHLVPALHRVAREIYPDID